MFPLLTRINIHVLHLHVWKSLEKTINTAWDGNTCSWGQFVKQSFVWWHDVSIYDGRKEEIKVQRTVAEISEKSSWVMEKQLVLKSNCLIWYQHWNHNAHPDNRPVRTCRCPRSEQSAWGESWTLCCPGSKSAPVKTIQKLLFLHCYNIKISLYEHLSTGFTFLDTRQSCSAARKSKLKTNLQLKLPSPSSDL